MSEPTKYYGYLVKCRCKQCGAVFTGTTIAGKIPDSANNTLAAMLEAPEKVYTHSCIPGTDAAAGIGEVLGVVEESRQWALDRKNKKENE